LYASKFVSGSSLTVKPGEWITARISFRIAVQNPKFEEVNLGRAALAMEWFQTVRTRIGKDCGVTLGYFPYDSFYNNENRVEVRNVEIKASGEEAEIEPRILALSGKVLVNAQTVHVDSDANPNGELVRFRDRELTQ
jgi:hypothetical protein